jgi:hypothetical protein
MFFHLVTFKSYSSGCTDDLAAESKNPRFINFQHTMPLQILKPYHEVLQNNYFKSYTEKLQKKYGRTFHKP